MKTQIKVSVLNISNDHVHFERILTLDDSVSVPYNSIVNTLLYLFNGLNIKVVIEQQNPF